MRRLVKVCANSALFVLVSSAMAVAQMAPGVFADSTHPAGAPDPEKVQQVWHVDPITGALAVKIPFTTTPVGGRGPEIPFALIYNSSSTLTLYSEGTTVTDSGDGYFNVICADVPNNDSACELIDANIDPEGEDAIIEQNFAWEAPSSNSVHAGPWTTSGPFIYATTAVLKNQSFNYSGGTYNGGNGCDIIGPYIYTDENGSAHDMNLIVAQGVSEPAAPPCTNASSEAASYGSTSMTVDGFALQTSTNLNGSIGLTTRNGAGPLVLYPDGTQFYTDGTLEDANGNQASFESDSLNRSTFSTNIPITQPGQIPTGTYSVTTTGVNGSEPYTVTVGTAPFGKFTMPHPVGGTQESPGDIVNSGYCPIMCPNEQLVYQVTAGSTNNVVKEIELPDGSSYTFDYDPTYGTISQINLPTGGYVTFEWGIRSDACQFGAYLRYSTLVVTKVTLYTGNGPNDGSTGTWNYNYQQCAASETNGKLTSTVTAPDGSSITYSSDGPFYYSDPFAVNAAPSWKVGSMLFYDSGNTLLKSVKVTHYNADYAPTVLNGLTTQSATTFYTKSGAIQEQVQYSYDNYANVIAKYESPYYACSGTPCSVPSTPPGGWARETLTSYVWSAPASGQPSYNYTTAHIVDKPSQIEVTNGSGAPLSIVQYIYDQGSLSGSAGIQNHDDTNFPSSRVGPRGNLTTEVHCVTLSSSGCTVWNKPITRTYDLAGMLQSMTDPNGNTTKYSYTDEYVNYSPAKPTDAYVTTVTHPITGAVSHIDSYTYYFAIGQMATHKDWNSQTTAYAWTDPLKLNRLTGITDPQTIDGTPGEGGVGNGTTTYNYTDSSAGWTVQKQTSISLNGTNLTTLDTYDGLGRLFTSQVTSDPEGTTTVTRGYDDMGRLSTITNPERSGSGSSGTNGTTAFSYDALGEKVSLQNPDSSIRQWCYNGIPSAGETNCNAQIGSTLGTWVDAQDENKNDWQQTSNSLGQMVTVGEPNGTTQTPSMETDYTYDALGNLWTVQQWGGASGSSGARVRTFTYDGLSRLIQGFNPESGWTCYGTTGGALPTGSNCTEGYDSNGNLQYRTDARGVVTNYAYDALNRLTGKSYTPPSPLPAGYAATPSVTYMYDQSSSTNPIGRRTGMTDGPGSQSWAYDSMGRISQINRTTVTPQSTQTEYASWQYNLDGNVTTGRFYTGTNYQYTYDGVGRQTSVGWVTGGTTYQYAWGATYDPASQLTGLVEGGSNSGSVAVTIADQYNNRLQPTLLSAAASSGTVFSHTLCYVGCYSGAPTENNGNIQMDVDNNNLPSDNSAYSATYKYDTLNRVISGQSQVWGDTYTYDSFGNLYQKTPLGSGLGENLVATPTTQNQLSGIGLVYDLAGNVIEDNFGNHYTYDAEGRLASAGSWSYSYDGDGNRVLRTAGGTTGSIYWYGADGTLTDEQSVQLNPTTDNPAQLQRDFYLNGHLVYRAANSLPGYFILYDQVGSTRVSIDSRWNPTTNQYPPNYTYYFPFGEYVAQPADTTLEQRFTGKERDTESGNDYFGARYYASTMGRFLSPDPIVMNELRMINPQRWNKYAYVINNPLILTDPTGKDAVFVDFSKKANGAGHAGLISVRSDGTATYSSFEPTGNGPAMVAPGFVDTHDLSVHVEFGTNGLPTAASYDALIKAVANIDGSDPYNVGLDYFKTTDSETAALDEYIVQRTAASREGKAPEFVVCFSDCRDYALGGLVAAGVLGKGQRHGFSLDPNSVFDELDSIANQQIPHEPKASVSVTVTNCVTTSDGKQQCNSF